MVSMVDGWTLLDRAVMVVGAAVICREAAIYISAHFKKITLTNSMDSRIDILGIGRVAGVPRSTATTNASGYGRVINRPVKPGVIYAGSYRRETAVRPSEGGIDAVYHLSA
jgi:hypothetical protein